MKRLLSLIAALAFLASCQYKDLCYDHPHVEKVKVRFDWSEATDAAPEWMELKFYPTDGTLPLERATAEMGESGIELPVGEYMCVCYNGGTESVFTSVKSMYLTTSHAAFNPLYKGYALHTSSTMNPPDPADQPFIVEPSPVYYGNAGIVRIEARRENEIVFKPVPVTVEVKVIIRNVTGMEYYKGLRSYFSGLTDGFIPETGLYSDDCGIILTELEQNGEDCLTCTFNCFGHNAADKLSIPHIFSVVAPLDASYAYRKSWDVSSLMHENPRNSRRFVIELDGLDIPTPELGSGLFNPTVSEWGDDNIIDVN